jgi:uncharacterized membrane protein YdjX (TVP38/TMEM64 family)
MRQRTWPKAVLLLLVIGVIGMGYYTLKDRLPPLDIFALAELLRALGPWAVVLGSGAIIVQTFVPFIPFIVLAGANVLVFGLWWGFLINWVSAVVGSICMFYLVRTYGRRWAERKLEAYPRAQKLNNYLQKNGFQAVFLLRLFPVILPLAVNLASGVSKIKASSFITATLLGKLPAIYVESLLGNDLLNFSDHKLRFFLILVGFLLFIGFGLQILKKRMKLS